VKESFYCDHEEADTRMLYHINVSSLGHTIHTQPPTNFVIRTTDTDCLVIALGCLNLLAPTVKIWMECGVLCNNTLRYINVNQLHTKLGQKLCSALPGYHAFTGCDYTAAFNRKGKVQPLKVLQKYQDIQNAFQQLTHESNITDETITKIQKFVCCIYGQSKLESVNEARLQIFLEKYRPRNSESTISNVIKLDSSALGPTFLLSSAAVQNKTNSSSV